MPDAAVDGRQHDGGRYAAIVFADITGSTRLYERLGDAVAREVTSVCIRILSDITERNKGRVVKTIGDEVMACFDSPVRAVLASNDMQIGVRDGNEEGLLSTSDMRIKIGMHYGPAIMDGTEVHGDAPMVASAVIGFAKADQILASGDIVSAVPPELRAGARLLERVNVGGRVDPIEIYDLIWDVSGATQIAGAVETVKRVTHTALKINFQGRGYEMNAQRPEMTLGRTQGNDIVVVTGKTSRNHARIEHRRGRFVVIDNSANGTFVIDEEGRVFLLKRETHVLDGNGSILLGEPPKEGHPGTLEYRCIT